MERVEPIKSLVPFEVKLNQHSAKVSSIKVKIMKNNEEVQVIEEQQKLDSNSSPMNIPTVARQQKISKIDLSGLISKQRDMVRNVVSKEWNRFSDTERDDDDVG